MKQHAQNKFGRSLSPKSQIQDAFNAALEMQKQGNFGEAKSLYLKILSATPDHFDSVHMLGLIESQNGDPKLAETLFLKATRLNPKFAAVHSNQGNLFKSLGRLEEALASFDRAIALKPDYAIAYSNRGLVLRELGRSDEALRSFDKAIRIKPDMKEAHFNCGAILLGLGRLDDALESFDCAILLKPDYVSALFNRGNAFKEKQHFSKALKDYDKVISLSPDHADAYSNRGLALQELGRPADAIASYSRAITLKPDFAEAYNNRGNTFKQLTDYNAALTDYTSALALKPDYADARYNRGVLNLMLQQFSSGWPEYEWRAQVASVYRESIAGHADIAADFSILNTGADFNGQTVFVASEQGVGDHIMFMSMLPELLRDAGNVICQLDPRLIKLFSRCFPEADYVPRGDVSILDRLSVDRYIRMGSLGYTYRQDIRDFPGAPYLTPDLERVAEWHSRIPLESGKRRIGISWRGGSRNTNGADRSMALEQLTPLLDREDCTFVSLQYGDVEEEVAAFNARRTQKLLCFPKREIDDFEDFASLIGALDGVVSVQNTTVHTCGALGKPCFAMLPFRPEWRYGASEERMPWYQSVKLFRQSHDGQWSDVIERVSRGLTAFERVRI